MKNHKKIDLGIGFAHIVFCVNEKAYAKYLKKHFKWLNTFEPKTDGETKIITEPGKGFYCVFHVCDMENIYEAKALLVHEMSHVTTEVMEAHRINDDEFRSYAIQKIYSETMPFYDKYLRLRDK